MTERRHGSREELAYLDLLTGMRGVFMLQEEERSFTVTHTAGKTLLVVADDPEEQTLFTEPFSLLTPYHIKVARNSIEAFHFVKHIKPSVFILEYRLPGIDGIELYDQLHATPGLERIPAILISSVSSEEVTGEIESRKLIHIEKPFDLDDVLLALANVLSWRRENA